MHASVLRREAQVRGEDLLSGIAPSQVQVLQQVQTCGGTCMGGKLLTGWLRSGEAWQEWLSAHSHG
jgi:hypothetical protein